MSATRPTHPEIALALLDLKRKHRSARAVADLRNDDASIADLAWAEDRGTETLKLIITVYGWPGHTLAGEAGADAAWWLAQHSDDQTLQEQALELLREAVQAGEATHRHLAFLTDRVRVRTGLTQLYGTAFAVDASGIQAFDIEDPDHLDQRRAEMGLEPFDQFDKTVRLLIKLPPATA
ncbi:hypothetical protein CG747_12710 [Streptomyces sp. CB02959]|uniref:DUF6624 domain-containing protein n=1 Tax=Streptomyces sp. CB02959 TaxID=2020330 RepID=UPI000C27EF52|nr:DUF6624 domain-containing protein [Streptomyces sp. CB02959]PJN40525.1 hypothetical protein CG747_12710 [Streptomyces sp. CB02959]